MLALPLSRACKGFCVINLSVQTLHCLTQERLPCFYITQKNIPPFIRCQQQHLQQLHLSAEISLLGQCLSARDLPQSRPRPQPQKCSLSEEHNNTFSVHNAPEDNRGVRVHQRSVCVIYHVLVVQTDHKKEKIRGTRVVGHGKSRKVTSKK